jgi:Glycosyl hydrolases family 38 N-terminal domain/Alpha mannosidase middle domain
MSSPAETRLHVTLVPHTHWDREWYEPFAVFSERLVQMMDTLLDLAAEGFPHFHLDGQTAMIDDYLERRPERADELAVLVREGRLSAGPWLTQMDEFLTSGESHLRNVEMGLERARELGTALEVGYMPDQFGHIGQMPQLLRLAGIERAVVWRGVPSAISTSTFRWQAPDGSEVLTESLPFGYSSGWALLRAEEPEALAEVLEREVERLRPFARADRILVMVGYDHSGPDATLPERLERAPAPPGVELTIGSVAEHVAGLEPRDDLPVWRGELRSSARAHLLPNVYSARANQKRERGRVESILERYAEPLAALVPRFAWPEDELRRAWMLLLWNGAHDSACGCSHDQVTADVDARFVDARAIGQEVYGRALTALGTQVRVPGVIRFNPSPFERDGVPGLGWAVASEQPRPDLVPVELEPVDGGVSADGIEIRLFDEPDVGDLYTWCPMDEDAQPVPPSAVSTDGAFYSRWDGLRAVILVRRRADDPFLRLDGIVQNERPDHRLRLHVGLPNVTENAVAGSPFELVDRPLVGEGSEGEAASPTWPARHVVMASGTAVFHEGVFEYEVIDGRMLAITLLRCVGTISREHLATRPWPAGPVTPTPNAQMIGDTSFALGIWPGASIDGLLHTWERFALPIVNAPANAGGDLPPIGSLLEIEGNAELSNVRRRDDELEVCLWNPHQDAPAGALVGDRQVGLRPAEISRVRMSDASRPVRPTPRSSDPRRVEPGSAAACDRRG